MNRRKFLARSGKFALATAAAPLLPRLFASAALAQSTPTYRAIVCIFLAGGNDGNNMLVPRDSHYAEYAAGRGSLALSQSSLLALKPASSGRAFGAHPALLNTAALYNSGFAAWLANAGTLNIPNLTKASYLSTPGPLNLFSHPDQQNEWQTGITQSACTTGWAGRIADTIAAAAPAVNVPTVISTAGWSLLGAGSKSEAASFGAGGGTITFLNSLQSLTGPINAMEGGDAANHLHDQISRTQARYLGITRNLSAAYQAGANLGVSFPQTGLGQQLQAVAQLINGRSVLNTKTQIFFCEDGNYDTHVDQLNLQGQNFATIDGAVGAFATAMQQIGMFGQVTLFTMTDFARSQAANATGGTDHAWGNHHLILGGGVKGGDVYGTFPSLVLGGPDDISPTNTGLWLPTTSNSQYAATLAKWLGVSSANLPAIFPELHNFASNPTLGFLGT